MSRLSLTHLVAAILCAVSIANYGTPAMASVVDATYTGPSPGNWGDSANWDVLVVPNNNGDSYNVFTGSQTVVVDGSFTVDTVNIDTGDLNIGTTSARSLTLAGGTSTIDGQIRLVDAYGYTGSAILAIASPVTLSGTGSLDFASSSEDNLVNGADPLTIGSMFTMQTLTNARGTVNAPLVNDGTILAGSGGELTLNENTTNNNLIQASGGTLTLDSLDVQNTAGTLTVSSGSNFNINDTSITGGMLSGDGTFNIDGASTFDGSVPMTLDTAATVQLGTTSAESLTIKEGLTNNNQIRLTDAGGYAGVAQLMIEGTDPDPDVELTGSGRVVFASSGTNQIIESAADPDARLALGAGQTITTSTNAVGQIYLPVTNEGVIEARHGTVTLYENVTNNNAIDAVDTGTMNLDELTVENGSGTMSVEAGSNFNIKNSTVTGGLLTGDGTFNINGASAFDGSIPITLDTAATVQLGTTSAESLTIKEGLTNNNQILLLDAGGYAGEAQLTIEGTDLDPDVQLTGSGRIVFASSGVNQIVESAADPDAVLELGAGQTVTTTTNSTGTIVLPVKNHGIIESRGGNVEVHENVTNDGLLQAVSGAEMTLDSMTVNNSASGAVAVDETSTLHLSNSTIAGGRIEGAGDLDVGGTNNMLDGSDITIDGPRILLGGRYAETLTLKGTLDSSSSLQMADWSGYAGAANLLIDGTVQLDGTGEVRFTTTGDNYVAPAGGGGSLNLGADHTIVTSTNTEGRIRVGMTNNGTVSADDGTITLETDSKTNNNLIQAVNSGTLNITTAIDNTNGTVSVEPGSQVYLDGTARISGGTVNGGGLVNIEGNSVVMENLTLDAIATGLGGRYAETLTLVGTIENNGTVTMSDWAGYAGAANLTIDGNVELGGSGSVVFNSNGDNYINAAGADTLTVGQSQTITVGTSHRGAISTRTVNNGIIEAAGGTLTLPNDLTNNGLVRSANGSTLVVGNDVAGTGNWMADGGKIQVQNVSVTTTGDISVLNGGELELNSATMSGWDMLADGAGIINIGSQLSLAGDLEFEMTDESLWDWNIDSSLKMTGGPGAAMGNWGAWASLEIGGLDLGTDPEDHTGDSAGFSNNFDLVELIVGADAHVYLADLIDNGNRGGSGGPDEALYVDTLTFEDSAATLNLNGLHLYYKNLNGDPGNIINEIVPEPATLLLLAFGGLLLRKKR